MTAIQATSQPSSEALKGELVHEVVERLHGDIKPVMENMIVNVEARLNEHSNDVFTAVIAKLSPILKVNETLYALVSLGAEWMLRRLSSGSDQETRTEPYRLCHPTCA